MKPSSASAIAYCTVSMLSAALEILYAGVRNVYVGAIAIEPRVDELKVFISNLDDYLNKTRG
jgi:hypothetical protein